MTILTLKFPRCPSLAGLKPKHQDSKARPAASETPQNCANEPTIMPVASDRSDSSRLTTAGVDRLKAPKQRPCRKRLGREQSSAGTPSLEWHSSGRNGTLFWHPFEPLHYWKTRLISPFQPRPTSAKIIRKKWPVCAKSLNSFMSARRADVRHG
jgi:hypothetical protein